MKDYACGCWHFLSMIIDMPRMVFEPRLIIGVLSSDPTLYKVLPCPLYSLNGTISGTRDTFGHLPIVIFLALIRPIVSLSIF